MVFFSRFLFYQEKPTVVFIHSFSLDSCERLPADAQMSRVQAKRTVLGMGRAG